MQKVFRGSLLLVLLLAVFDSYAQWQLALSNNLFYTDDASLFTVTQQLSLLDDPTQPTVDRPNGRSDFIYEPTAAISWALPTEIGKTSFYFKAGGYVFAANPDFTHTAVQASITQQLSTDTAIGVIYRLIPDRFLGKNSIELESGEAIEGRENLASHILALHIEQKLTDKIEMHVLGRYGLRDYDGVFEHRNTHLWTVGTHLKIEISEDTEIYFGYHYEKGNASSPRARVVNDDVSYHTHYASIEIETLLSQNLRFVVDFDFEKNIFTTANGLDEHFGNPEEIFLGSIKLRYALSDATLLSLGFQHGSRKKKNENTAFHNNNIWLGLEFTL